MLSGARRGQGAGPLRGEVWQGRSSCGLRTHADTHSSSRASHTQGTRTQMGYSKVPHTQRTHDTHSTHTHPDSGQDRPTTPSPGALTRSLEAAPGNHPLQSGCPHPSLDPSGHIGSWHPRPAARTPSGTLGLRDASVLLNCPVLELQALGMGTPPARPWGLTSSHSGAGHSQVDETAPAARDSPHHWCRLLWLAPALLVLRLPPSPAAGLQGQLDFIKRVWGGDKGRAGLCRATHIPTLAGCCCSLPPRPGVPEEGSQTHRQPGLSNRASPEPRAGVLPAPPQSQGRGQGGP